MTPNAIAPHTRSVKADLLERDFLFLLENLTVNPDSLPMLARALEHFNHQNRPEDKVTNIRAEIAHRQQRAKNVDFPGRDILLLLDRAPWHHGQARQFVLAHPHLDSLYFPPGCPDLNPHEHVWKLTRQAVGHLWDCPNIGDLRQAFQAHLDNTLFRFGWIAKYLPGLFYESVSL